ncbi:MAG TPA: hypothetical protein VF420_13295 [Casimicrobiaceae bacterium]
MSKSKSITRPRPARARAEKPICQRTGEWLRGRKLSTAALTGQDARALHAFVHLLELYVVSDATGRNAAVLAMRSTLQAMQQSTRHLAKATIPQSLDWQDEERLWEQIANPEVVSEIMGVIFRDRKW